MKHHFSQLDFRQIKSLTYLADHRKKRKNYFISRESIVIFDFFFKFHEQLIFIHMYMNFHICYGHFLMEFSSQQPIIKNV
jgi:hypothetical protein